MRRRALLFLLVPRSAGNYDEAMGKYIENMDAKEKGKTTGKAKASPLQKLKKLCCGKKKPKNGDTVTV